MKFRSTFGIFPEIERYSGSINVGLQRLLKRYQSQISVEPNLVREPRWSADFFSYNQSSVFQNLSEENKSKLLERCELSILTEIQNIEIAGMSFATRMALMAETDQERQLYCHFAADEARHYSMITAIVGQNLQQGAGQDSFAGFIGNLIDQEERLPLMFMIQVILEGWGIQYYTHLKNGTSDPQLKEVFGNIIKDEAGHHGSGVLLFEANQIPAQFANRITEIISYFLSSVRLGPITQVKFLAEASGGLSEVDIEQYLLQTSFDKKVQSDLSLIRSLISKADGFGLIDTLESQGLLSVPSAKDCAKAIYRSIAA